MADRAYCGHSVRGEVAIVGMACVYPGARNHVQFWQNIVDKFSAITEVDPQRWDPELHYDPNPDTEDRLYCKVGGFVGNSFSFNAVKLGVPPSALEGGEPDHFLVLRTVYEALEDANYLTRSFDRQRTSLILGRGGYLGPGMTWLIMRTLASEYITRFAHQLRPDLTPEQLKRIVAAVRSKLPKLNAENSGGLIPNIVSGRTMNRLDFMGRNYTIDGACASSLLAVEDGILSLLQGRDDLVLAGGCHISMHVPFLSVFDSMRAMSLSSTIRPYDENADGTLSSEGVGMLVLKRLADAERDGDRIYAVIKGAGSASDGKAKGVLAPRVEGEELAMRRGLEMAEASPDSIGLIEGHGTGTLVGDATELETLGRVFGNSPDGRKTVALGAVKSNIGHAMPAAGAAGLIKTALALYHRVLPATINVTRPKAELLAPESRVYLNSETRPWIHGRQTPRRAGVNAFGFGGINSHVVLEEYRGADETSQPTLMRDWDQEAFVFEGATREDLLAHLARVRDYAVAVEGVAPCDLAYTLNTSLTGQPLRVAIVASGFEDLAAKIGRVATKLADPECKQIRERQGLYYFESPELREAKLGFLYPGEGSQYVNMLADLAIHFPAVRQAFDMADAAVDGRGVPPSAILFPPPAFSEGDEAAAEAELFSIERATETVLAGDGAVYRLLDQLQLKPDVLAGHSAGEWIAMATSGMMDVERFLGSMDRLAAMYQRVSENMAVPRMAMLAVGAGIGRAQELAAELEIQIRIANDNCPHQVVIVVEPEQADRLAEHMLKSGVFVERLPYDRGYHTPAFDYLSAPLREFFSSLDLRPPQTPVLSCTTAEYFPTDPSAILDVVAETFARPLIFQQTIERMYADGVRIFVEAGPRGNLTAFVDDILRGRPHLAVPVDQYRRPGLLSLQHAVAMLAAVHRPMKLDVLYERRSPRKLTLDAKADSVLPEDKQPGIMQVSLCHRLLIVPDEPEVRGAPAAAPQPSQPEVPAPQPEPASALVTVHDAEYVDAPLPAGPISLPGAYAVAQHFALMEEFLDTQASVMSALAGAAAPAQVVALPEQYWDAEVYEPEAPVPHTSSPMLTTMEVIEEAPEHVRLLFTLDLDEHRYLLDHVLYHRKSFHGNDCNRLANMPLTGTVELFCEAAMRHFGGVVVAIRDVRTPRPIYAEEGAPVNQVTLDMRRLDAHRVECILRGTQSSYNALKPGDLLAAATLVMGEELPDPPPPLEVRLTDPKPGISGGDMYATHAMFHGPRFQNIVSVDQVGPEGLLARLRVFGNADCFGSTSAPDYFIDPHVFDAAGQTAGYWPTQIVGPGPLLPIRVGEITRYNVKPAPDSEVEVRLVVRSFTTRQLSVDYDLVLPDGTLWLRVTGWEDWCFHWTAYMFEFYQFPWKTLNGRTAGINGLERAGGVCQLLDQIAEMQKPGVSEMVWSRAILSPRELEIYYAIASDEQRMSWLFQMGAAKDAVRAYSRRQGHELSPCDIEIDLMPGDIGVSGAWTTELHPPRVAVAFDHGIAVGAGAAQPVAVAIERVSRDAAPSSASFLPEEREWIERLKDPSEWTARATAAKRAVAKWMRPQQEEDPAYWASMAILRLDETAGELSVADPGMAVNAEDTVTVYTHRDGDRIVAVAMK